MRLRRATFAAGAALTLAAALLATSMVERLRATTPAWTLADVETEEEASPVPPPLLSEAADPEATEPTGDSQHPAAYLGRVSEIASTAPFSPTRQPPAARFSLTGPADGEDATADPVAHAPNVRLLGVAHYGKGYGLAAVEVDGYPPRVLRVGDLVAGLALLSVRADGATLRGPDGNMDLGVSGRGGSR